MAEIFKNILIATDGSKRTMNAIKKGVELARLQNSSIYAVYVIDNTVFNNIPVDSVWTGMHDLLEKEGNEAINMVKEAAGDGVAIEAHVVEGSPAIEITKFAGEHNIDLIVVGTLGKSGIDRILLGSVAESIVRMADCPVLVVKSPEE
ncbi:universal stress protein [Methanocella sp. CWC-04]|uniref:Universal stress protein n=1 Tax=Methanooceanicella nereidis TaxID=2052831 RepID=A0AAP2RAN0_9EURY|nr:universal stress protein [Methanocella sp. CWC-04]MCD1293838.1 universal stress protein [Methanocella sp. CWC-04]